MLRVFIGLFTKSCHFTLSLEKLSTYYEYYKTAQERKPVFEQRPNGQVFRQRVILYPAIRSYEIAACV
jgi:hypothetical protein